jgi:hypothetical protein
MFKDWRLCDQSTVPFKLDQTQFYYIQAQAWHLKGYLGGTHSWFAFWHNQWLVIELTDLETLDVQSANVIHAPWVANYTDHAPYISNRPYNAKWFGHAPHIINSCPAVAYDKLIEVADSYPFKDFKILYRNCNTFASYLIYKLQLPLKRPFKSVGFRSSNWWNHQLTMSGGVR